MRPSFSGSLVLVTTPRHRELPPPVDAPASEAMPRGRRAVPRPPPVGSSRARRCEATRVAGGAVVDVPHGLGRHVLAGEQAESWMSTLTPGRRPGWSLGDSPRASTAAASISSRDALTRLLPALPDSSLTTDWPMANSPLPLSGPATEAAEGALPGSGAARRRPPSRRGGDDLSSRVDVLGPDTLSGRYAALYTRAEARGGARARTASASRPLARRPCRSCGTAPRRPPRRAPDRSSSRGADEVPVGLVALHHPLERGSPPSRRRLDMGAVLASAILSRCRRRSCPGRRACARHASSRGTSRSRGGRPRCRRRGTRARAAATVPLNIVFVACASRARRPAPRGRIPDLEIAQPTSSTGVGDAGRTRCRAGSPSFLTITSSIFAALVASAPCRRASPPSRRPCPSTSLATER